MPQDTISITAQAEQSVVHEIALLIRLHKNDKLSAVLLRIFAGAIVGNQLTVSISTKIKISGIVRFLQSKYCKGLRDYF